jgi:fatty acid desaturase
MAATPASRLEQFPVQHYAREVRPHLPTAVFQPALRRLAWLPVHLSVIVGLAFFIVAAAPPWYIALCCALLTGHSWACLAFLAHETLHHAVVKSRALERLVGYCGLGIFLLSPTLWVAWHNQEHHGNTGNPDRDPDTFGTLGSWEYSAVDRALVKTAAGSGRKRSAALLFVTFSFHSLVVLLGHSERSNYYARISRRVVYAETAGMLAFWMAVLALVGAWSFLFIYVLPLLVANAVTMSYIATNHHLNSLTALNDPLANALSVSNAPWLETLHLHFGYHVEHHVFPTVSGRHAPIVRDALVRLYGERYLTLPHARALRLLYTRPKIHDTHDTVVDPRTLMSFNTLAPGALEMDAVGSCGSRCRKK